MDGDDFPNASAALLLAKSVLEQRIPAAAATALRQAICCACGAPDMRLMLLAPGVLIATDNLLTPSELLHLGLVCYPAPPSVQQDKPQWPLELDVLGRQVQLQFWSTREVQQWLTAPQRAQVPVLQLPSGAVGVSHGPICGNLVLHGCDGCNSSRRLNKLATEVALHIGDFATALVTAVEVALVSLRQPAEMLHDSRQSSMSSCHMDRLLSWAASSDMQPGMSSASPGSPCEPCLAPPAADKGASPGTAGTANIAAPLPPPPASLPHSSRQHTQSPHHKNGPPEDGHPFDPASRCASWDDGCMFDEDNFAAAAMPPLSGSFSSRLASGSWGPLTHSSWGGGGSGGGGGGGGGAVSASRDGSLDDPLQSWLLHAEWQAPRDHSHSFRDRLSGGSGSSDQSPLRDASAHADSDGQLQPACLQSDHMRDAAAFAADSGPCIPKPALEPMRISPFAAQAAAGSPRQSGPAPRGPSLKSQHTAQPQRPAESKAMGQGLPAHGSGVTVNTAAAECGSMPRLSSDLEPSGPAAAAAPAAVLEGVASGGELQQDLSLPLLKGKETGACRSAGGAEQSMTPLLAFRDPGMERRFASWQTAHHLQADVLCSFCLLLLYLAAALVPGLAKLSLAPLHHGLAACLAAAPMALLHVRPVWYLARREALLQLISAGLLAIHCFKGSSGSIFLPARAATEMQPWRLFPLLLQTILALGFRVRLQRAALSQVLQWCMCASAAVQQQAGGSAGKSVPNLLAEIGATAAVAKSGLALALLLPCMVLFRLEQRARDTFLHSAAAPAAAAAAHGCH